MVPMIFSIILRGVQLKIPKQVFELFIIIIAILIIPIVLLGFGAVTNKYFLINYSNADAYNSTLSQLVTPTLSFTVIKHFIFFVLYLAFICANTDIIKDTNNTEQLILILKKLFRIIFVGLIFEWIVVNIFGMQNIRSIDKTVFALTSMNMTQNWSTWGSYSVAFCFTERSEVSIVLLYYLLFIKQKEVSNTDAFWLLVSFVAIYCTGSSTALIIAIGCILLIAINAVVINLNVKKILLSILLIVVALAIYFKYGEMLFGKISSFASDDSGINFGSAYTRNLTIKYGMQAFSESPLFGVGIGTIYSNGMLVQTISNIGILGVVSTFIFHYLVSPFRFTFINVLEVIYAIAISYSAFMVENFTSPFLIMIFMIFALNGGNRVKQNS